ncbi:hypothetical protein [Amorphus orientalis]|uniref:Uncharacterized protein n=1 Tax=Amorphus orientalis TaxID=649198 RepID=A0AAE3VL22_9HYPH|nr:hypothetical protein [Amorphus orientalis]MDQ0313750.1 hypothetical protein [Amorphus orientalis]
MLIGKQGKTAPAICRANLDGIAVRGRGLSSDLTNCISFTGLFRAFATGRRIDKADAAQ